jgi:hypothetical protein
MATRFYSTSASKIGWTEMRVDPYFEETAELLASASLVDRLRGALQAAEELEQRGVDIEEAWRNDEDWQRIGRIRILLHTTNALLEPHTNRDVNKWRTRELRRRSIRLVEE